jgi:hypothetical protein
MLKSKSLLNQEKTKSTEKADHSNYIDTLTY